MKKIREKFAFFLILMAVIFVAVPVSANAMPYTRDSHIKNAVSDYEESKSYDYVIDSYDINIKVNENNTFDITEKLEVYFNEERHGIYRTIPLSNTVTRLDGTTSRNRAKVSNLKVSENYFASRENNMIKIRIGSEDEFVSGKQTYTIRYNYNIGKDPCKDMDELYLNIIGDEWDTMIGNITFTIKMPKKFDETKLGFSAGKTGSTESSNVLYYVDGKKIIGEYMGELNPKEALTVRCELPEGYFVNAGLPAPVTAYLLFIIPIACLLIALTLWFLFGRDRSVIETVEFYPPENFNSLEIGYLYKGRAENKDVVSLLIYLANKGYIGISQTTERSLFDTQGSFEFTQLKKYDGDDKNEKLFLNGLFRGKSFADASSETNDSGETNAKVTKSDLYHSFFRTIDVILRNLNGSKEYKKKLFETTSKKSVIIVMMIILCTLSAIIIPTYEATGQLLAIVMCLPILFLLPFWAVGFMSRIPVSFRILWMSGTIFATVGFLSGLPLLTILADERIFLIGFFVSMVCIIGMIACFKLMPKRTKYGSEILGRIKGFKRFLETAEKEKLEMLVMENPTYFYDILPYTYVLGVSDKWMKQFETISLRAPEWYQSSDHFSMNHFRSFMNETMNSAQSVMTSQPSSSSSSSSGSSFSSGGGSSGGGSGGGGGGSW